MTTKKKTNNISNTGLSEEDLRDLILQPCKNKNDFKKWIYYFLEMYLPDCKVSRYADTTPFDAAWQIYDICVNKNNKDNIKDILFCSSRGAGKTLSMAIAELMIMLHDRRSVVHIGAIISQASRCYQYQQSFFGKSKFQGILRPLIGQRDAIIEQESMRKTTFNIEDEQVTIEVLPLTIKATNGAHVPLVVCDEIDTANGEGLKAFKEISGMLDSKGNQKALRVGISTRKGLFGLMNQLIEDAPKARRTVKYWTAFEFHERCLDEKSGKNKVPIYICQDRMESISESEWLLRDEQKRKEYIKYELYENCHKCALASICLGDAKNQKSKSPMLKPLDELEQKVLSEGPDWALSQLMNLKPSLEGVIFKEFDEKTHVKNWNELWKILTGKDFPGICTHDLFVKKCYSADTEVLTNNGFKLFKDLTHYDTIASLDDNGRLIYESPTDYISYHYKGKMYNIHNSIGGHGKQLDLLVTPQHNQVYLSSHFRKNGNIKLIKTPVENLPVGDFYIPAAPFKYEEKRGIESPISFMTADQYLAYIGFWIAEGSIGKDNNNVSVCQLKPEFMDEIRELIYSIKWPQKIYERIDISDGGISWDTYNKELHDHLELFSKRLAVNKRVPRFIIENANYHQLKIILKWLMIGDGANYKNNMKQQPYYSTGSKQLSDDVQEIAFRLGYRTNLTAKYKRIYKQRKNGTHYLNMFRVQIHNKSLAKTKKCWYIGDGNTKSEYSDKINKHIEIIDNYDDLVYCVTMPSGRLFVRRNGVIALSGNCHEMKIPSYGGVDWGWTSPSTVVYMFIDKRDNIYVVRADGRTYVNDPTWIHYMNTKYQRIYRTQLYFPDIANGSAIDLMKPILPVANEIDKSINLGIQTIKKFMLLPGTNESKLFIAKETCDKLINEFKRYHYEINTAGIVTDTPADEYNHYIDALRYPLTMLLGKSSGKAVIADDEYIEDIPNFNSNNNTFINPPSATEFAQVLNINFNDNSQDVDKIGKVGKLDDLLNNEDDNDDGNNVGGGGGLLWSF